MWNNEEYPEVVGIGFSDVVSYGVATDRFSGTRELRFELADQTLTFSLMPMTFGLRRLSRWRDPGLLALLEECPDFSGKAYNPERVVNQGEANDLLVALVRTAQDPS